MATKAQLHPQWWWRRIRHPLIKQLYGTTAEACSFVDAVEAVERGKAAKGSSQSKDELLQKQWKELTAVAQYALAHE